MPITVRSPHSGQPVKIRDQDVGRAVRDPDGRVFYVVPRPSGEGFYSSLTRKGSAKDELRYDALLEKDAVLADHRAATNPPPQEVVDATGKGRKSPALRLLLILLVLAALGAAGWYGYVSFEANRRPANPLDNLVPEDVPEVAPSTPDAEAPPQAEPVSLRLAPPPRWAAQRATLPPQAAEREPEPEPPAVEIVAVSQRAEPGQNKAGPEPIKPTPDPPPAVLRPAQPTPTPNRQPVQTRAVEPTVPPTAAATIPTAAPDPFFDFTTTASGLRYRVERRGDGPRAHAQDYAVVRYRVTHPPTGLELDATPEDEPLGFVLWSGMVFRGLDEGVAGMRVGERRTLLVPAKLATFGFDAPGVEGVSLPPATLHVDVELLNVLPGVRKQIKQPGQGEIALPGDTVLMHWSLYVEQGTQAVLDSRQFGTPTTVLLGSGDIIPGMELGVAGMAEGEVADLFIPPYLAYGAGGAAAGLVPAHAAVRCRVELLKVAK